MATVPATLVSLRTASDLNGIEVNVSEWVESKRRFAIKVGYGANKRVIVGALPPHRLIAPLLSVPPRIFPLLHERICFARSTTAKPLTQAIRDDLARAAR